MKSGSVASVAVLLTLGVLAGVTLVREHSGGVITESEDFASILGAIGKAVRRALKQKMARVQAVIDKLELDDNRDLYRLYDYIMNQEWNEKCQSGGKSCAMVVISFTTANAADAGTSDTLRYHSMSQISKTFRFSPKKPGETGMKEVKFSNPVLKNEVSFKVEATGKSASRVRINWVFSRVWDQSKQKDMFVVAVAPNRFGWNSYSKESETAGGEYTRPGWVFQNKPHDYGEPQHYPYSDAWAAFDTPLISERIRYMRF